MGSTPGDRIKTSGDRGVESSITWKHKDSLKQKATEPKQESEVEETTTEHRRQSH